MNWRLLCLCLLLTPAHSATLGRVFFTPAQRAALDHPPPPPKPAKPEPKIISVQLNGIVQKHGGARTVWVNGQAQQQTEDNNPERATLQFSQQKIQLDVGQHAQISVDDEP